MYRVYTITTRFLYTRLTGGITLVPLPYYVLVHTSILCRVSLCMNKFLIVYADLSINICSCIKFV